MVRFDNLRFMGSRPHWRASTGKHNPLVSEEAVILLAEDREDDIFLIQRAFKRAHLSNPLYVVRDGDEAIEYLKGEDKFSNRVEYPLPDLMLLDLKMPRLDGFEVLKWVRANPSLNKLRIVVLTSSEIMADRNLAYQLGANSFLVKPLQFERFVEAIKMLSQYWLTLDKMPEVSRATEMLYSRLPRTE
jgi:CheY-like chemotaxis protein